MCVWKAACPEAGMKGRQVAERGQQKPGQPPAQVREAQRPQAGVWTSAGTHRGRQRDTKMEIHSERQTHRDSEMVVDTQRQKDREKGRKRED